MSEVKDTNPLIQEAADICRASYDGASAIEVAQMLGVGTDRTQKVLSAARKLGLLVVYKVPDVGFRWMSATAKARLLADWKKDPRFRERAYLAYPRTREDKADYGDWEIERRITVAGVMPPPETTAPNSVFTWRPAA